MIGHPVLATAPTQEPIGLIEVKAHLRVDFEEDNDYIDTLIVVARQQLEAETKRALITQTWDTYFDLFPPCIKEEPRTWYFSLPFGALQSVTSVKYTDADNNESTVSASTYHAATWEDPGRIVLAYGQTWPSVTLRTVGGVVVRFVCGYGAPSAVPAALKQSMLLRIAHWYENREEVIVGQGITVHEVPNAAKALAWPYRINIV